MENVNSIRVHRTRKLEDYRSYQKKDGKKHMSYFSYEEFGGVPSSDRTVRIINFNGADYKIRCADRGVPYLILCHENQKTTMEGNWLLEISDEDCKQKIKLAFVLLAKFDKFFKQIAI